MDPNAANLANKLNDSNLDQYLQEFPLQDGNYIVVLALRTDPSGLEILRAESQDLGLKAVARPSGKTCPRCKGTGKI